jgi:hypothetical protein
MKHFCLLLSIASAFCTAKAAVTVDDAARKLIKRCHELTGAQEALVVPIHHPDNRAERALARLLAAQQNHHQPVIIYGLNNPDYPAFVTHGAFATFSPGSLKGTVVICAVGTKYEKLLRGIVTSTGATLYLEPPP